MTRKKEARRQSGIVILRTKTTMQRDESQALSPSGTVRLLRLISSRQRDDSSEKHCLVPKSQVPRTRVPPFCPVATGSSDHLSPAWRKTFPHPANSRILFPIFELHESLPQKRKRVDLDAFYCRVVGDQSDIGDLCKPSDWIPSSSFTTSLPPPPSNLFMLFSAILRPRAYSS